MASNITYRTVLSDAIKGFNDIQTKMTAKSRAYGVTFPEAVTSESPVAIKELSAGIKNYLVYPNGTKEITPTIAGTASGGYYTIAVADPIKTTDEEGTRTGYLNVKIPAVTTSTSGSDFTISPGYVKEEIKLGRTSLQTNNPGNISGTNALAILTDDSTSINGVNNISNIVSNKAGVASEPTSGYYLKIRASSSGVSKTVTASPRTDGFIKTTDTVSKEVGYSAANLDKYYPIVAGSIDQTSGKYTKGYVAEKGSITIENPTIVSGSQKLTPTSVSVSFITKDNTNTNDISGVDGITIDLSKGTGYFIGVKGTSSSVSATTFNVTGNVTAKGSTAGYIDSSVSITKSNFTLPATASVNSKTGSNYYINIKPATCTVSGGEVSISNGTLGTDAFETTKPTTGTDGTDYFSISSTRAAVTDTHTAGYMVAGAGSGLSASTVTKYIKKATASVSGTATATTPTISLDEDNDNITLTDTKITTTKPESGYYAAVKAIAPATTISLSKSVTKGFLKDNSQISASARTNERSSNNYYLTLKTGSVSAAASATIVDDIADNDSLGITEHTGTSMLLESLPANLTQRGSFECKTAGVGKPGISKYYKTSALSDTAVIAEASLVKGTTYYYNQYFTLSAVTAQTTSVNEGYIKAGNTSFTKAGNKNYYMPLATFKYVTNSTAGDFIQVERGGYVAAGVLTDVSSITGSIDRATIDITGISIGAESDSAFPITVSSKTINAGYTDSNTAPTISAKLPKLTASTSVSGGNTSFTPTLSYAASTSNIPSNEIILSTIASSSDGLPFFIKIKSNADSATATVSSTTTVSTAGYLKSGTVSTGSKTVTSTLNSSGVKYLSVPAGAFKADGGALSVSSSNTTSATPALKGYARITTDANNYVLVGVNRAAVTTSATASGYIKSGQSSAGITAGSTSVKIPAVSSASVSANVTGSVSRIQTYTKSGDGDTATITADSIGTNYGALSVSGSNSNIAHKYVIGNNAATKGTVNFGINADTTGTSVDAYVLSLYRRMEGLAYDDRSAD